jgi:hypothetical protein
MGSIDSHGRPLVARKPLVFPSTPETAIRRAFGCAQSMAAVRLNFSVKAPPNRRAHLIEDKPLKIKRLELSSVE